MKYAMGKKKRALDNKGSGDEDDCFRPDMKRPALANVIVEALKVDTLQKLCSSLEPILRRVVSEEVERALARLGPAKLTGRSPPKRCEAHDGRNLQLHFKSRLSLPLFTGGKVEGEHGTTIEIVLIDANTGRVVSSGPESCTKLDVVVLEGDFRNEDDSNWTQEDFESNIVKEREGKRPLLTGELQVTLKDGVGSLGDLTFTDNSSWVRSRKFKIGLKVSSGCCEGIRIREAKTDAFTVKDHRGELYKKHYPPALTDEVWRLEKIGKDGSFHKRLNKAGIFTVEDFLRLVVRDSQRLRNILGSGMSNKMWDVLLEHARTCGLSGKLYVYYPDDARHVGVIFNNIYELCGLIANGQYYAADSLLDNQKIYVDGLVKQAYENWMHFTEYDGKFLLDVKQDPSTIAPQAIDVSPAEQQNLSSPFDHSIALPGLYLPVQPEQPGTASGSTITGFDEGMAAARSSLQSSNGNLNLPVQFDATSLPIQDQLVGSLQQSMFPNSDNLLPLGPAQPSGPTSHPTPYLRPEDLLSGEEIHVRSQDMLENEDMQLLGLLSAGGHANPSFNIPEDGFLLSSTYSPSTSSFGGDQSRSGKALLGWLKLKAALRWGTFVRKKAAERRAHLVELDES